MRTHPLWNPFQPPSLEAIIQAGETRHLETVAGRGRGARPGLASVVRRGARRVAAALRDRVLAIEHIGSTAVPGLWAKPMFDVDLTVADSADEDAWLPDLEAAGFGVRVREPDWEEHRVLRGQNPTTKLHVFPRRSQVSRGQN